MMYKLQPVRAHWRRVRDRLRTPPHEELMEAYSFDLLMKEVSRLISEIIEADMAVR